VTAKYIQLLYYWLPLIAYCLMIFVQSAYPSPEIIPQRPLIDKLLHFLAYALMGILFFRAYRTLPIHKNYNLLILISMLSAILYGVSDEIHQHFVPWRHADLMDALADALGSVFGVFLYAALNKKIGFKTL
jgi:VanZ family protein